MEDEQVLVTRAQNGDTDAFAQLYDRHIDAIYRYVLLRVPVDELAEDLTEDVFLKAWQALPRFKQDKPLRHWLYRIAHNRIVDEQRRKSQQELSLDALIEVGQHPTAPSPSPLHAAIAREDIQELRAALATMTPEEQALLTLRFTEELSFQDIADILDKSAGACRVLQHRALKKLAQKLYQPAEVAL